jgi:hypothetical protein
MIMSNEVKFKDQPNSFFETTLGKVILGFLFTTIVGGLLNFFIQSQIKRNNDELTCKERFIDERYNVQEKLLETAAKRYHLTGMIYGKLHNKVASENEELTNDAKAYWEKHLTDVKDVWNQKVIIYHSKLQLLYGKDKADSLIEKDKNLHSKYCYQPKERATTLQEAFEHAHETTYYLAFECNGKKGGCKDAGEKIQHKSCADNDTYPDWDTIYYRLPDELAVLNIKIKALSDTLITGLYETDKSCKQSFWGFEN